MHCFICVTYVIILCSARPPETKDLASRQQERSLFRDVIESLRIRTHLPEDANQNEENNLYQNDERYYENDQSHLPSDADFIPRRNDRIEMPTLKYRFPKSLENNTEEEKDLNHEVVVYIETTTETKPTKKPHKRPIKLKEHETKENETTVSQNPLILPIPFTNTMGGSSQIGHRESQTVIKPTVIVNLRGTVSHRDSDVRLQKRQNYTIPDLGPSVFNVKQEINLYRNDAKNDNDQNGPKTVKQEVKITEKDIKKYVKKDEDMLMCESAGPKSQKGRNMDVLQILLSI
ncbi:uncharacterized protein LOC128670982 [Plodia interpunctella]|uniref:uncharacterized protein LOC128670982 n=1 Tax=Plodia interpunctella TaxID=58824 RepID=UPI002368D8D4|nr:uncharacterized protein LOC128670982 [Plodia interpunctella]